MNLGLLMMHLSRGGFADDGRHGGIEDESNKEAFCRLLRGIMKLVPDNMSRIIYCDPDAMRVCTDGKCDSFVGLCPVTLRITNGIATIDGLDAVVETILAKYNSSSSRSIKSQIANVQKACGRDKLSFYNKLCNESAVLTGPLFWALFRQVFYMRVMGSSGNVAQDSNILDRT